MRVQISSELEAGLAHEQEQGDPFQSCGWHVVAAHLIDQPRIHRPYKRTNHRLHLHLLAS